MRAWERTSGNTKCMDHWFSILQCRLCHLCSFFRFVFLPHSHIVRRILAFPLVVQDFMLGYCNINGYIQTLISTQCRNILNTRSSPSVAATALRLIKAAYTSHLFQSGRPSYTGLQTLTSSLHTRCGYCLSDLDCAFSASQA